MQRYCEHTGYAERLVIPYMRYGPARTVADLEQLIHPLLGDPLMLVGSSLGGFYATYLAQKYGCPAVLINPAVRPYELWQDHLGEQPNFYTGDIHRVEPQHIEELRDLDVQEFSEPEDFMVLLETGDETLDYRQAQAKFSRSRLVVHEGGSHSYDHFTDDLPQIFEFFLSRLTAAVR